MERRGGGIIIWRRKEGQRGGEGRGGPSLFQWKRKEGQIEGVGRERAILILAEA